MSDRRRAAGTAAAGAPAGTGDAAVWAGLAAAAAVLAATLAAAGPPLGRLLFPPASEHFFAVWTGLVHPKPTEEARYLLAVAATIAGAIGLARLPPAGLPAGRAVRAAGAAAKLAAAGVAVWCFRRYEEADGRVGVGHFRLFDLVAAAVLAGVVAGLVRWRPAVVAPADGERATRRRRRASAGAGAGAAAVVTAGWLLPAIFADRDIGHALFVMWWHLQFVYGDFVATLGGRTPLVDYNAEYGSLLPLAAAPVLRAVGPSVGAFTTLMCALTLAALMAVERTLAQLCRSERLGLALYLPFLAGSLFTDYRVGVERFYFANYYGVFPLRYLGPYLLLWLCVGHLRGRRPHHAAWLFLVGGLATLNDVEFGLPALAATGLALAAAAPRGARVRRWLAPLAGAAGLGVAGAVAAVVAVLYLRTGRPLELGRLTRYAQLFGRAGFGEVPTPTLGLHLVMYASFVATLTLAALRHRREAADRALTGALAFAGVFGLGAGSYYMGGSNPSQLIGVFSAWALAVALLALLAVRALAARRAPVFAAAAALVMAGLLTTAATQFPAPWTQVRRIAARSAQRPYDRTAASAFVRRTASRGERVVVLEGLGPLVAREAGVVDVSPYSEVWAVWSREQLAEIVAALRRVHGTRFYLGRDGASPEIPTALAADGFRPVASDPASRLTEWRLAA